MPFGRDFFIIFYCLTYYICYIINEINSTHGTQTMLNENDEDCP